ncbi:DUF2264 domain-containing protein [Cohnella luojiensis]|uniref:DUF2264 domain-containing protein n=1 Tax=Cohnella luojiensis TaxID=652876 RepID=A0A4Y8LU65_9BACL|nr:DUF2264 domain-containing protein [Cohnella luojiensis]TFE23307.1 DUF2264 domain-containing protein [Cohnella luojiensis]
MGTGIMDRSYWLETLAKLAEPVLGALENGALKETMPVEGGAERVEYSHLEALGRLLAGMAPWLESRPMDEEEERNRERYARMARNAIDQATNPSSPDFMNFSAGYQPIVDAAFLSHAIVRAPGELWERLSPRVQAQVTSALLSTRSRKPGFSNWLLFSAMIETALLRIGQDWDPMRIDYALRQHEQWYLGDGMYSDGPEYRADYYNSFVIQPMLVDIVDIVQDQSEDWAKLRDPIMARALRYSTVQERLISPEGTFPVIGRSIAYRMGAFQSLAQSALRGELSSELVPSQVRCALTAVMRRLMDAPRTFDDGGWLRIGFCGHQPELGESYISTGSLYLCALVFLPLGLREDTPFWQGESMPWTSVKAWSGQYTPRDQAI